MAKKNDFFAATLNAPENFGFDDFFTHDITPENTELKDPEYYKTVKQVQNKFTENGTFNEDAFNSYYNGVLRLYNDFTQTDYVQQIIDSVERAPESIRDLSNTNIKDTSVTLYSNPDPWRKSRGMQGIRSEGDPSFDIREVAQANYMRDENGNILNYKPNDLKFFKGLFAKPAVLAEDEYGNPLLDDNGDPYYRELKKGEDIAGKTLLHWTDTFTEDDSALNKFDFFDRDGLKKSVGGILVDNVFRIAPYFIPYVGQVIGGLQAVTGLVSALPMVVKSVDGLIENNPNSTITKKMNELDAFMSRYDRSKSRKSMEKNWTWENVGDMFADSVMQLRQQKTFSYIPQIMGAFDKAKKLERPSEAAIKWGRNASLAFMALTSAEDSFNTFRAAGVDQRTSGVAALAYAASLYGLMNQDYFKEWLFKDTWLTTDPELKTILKQANKEASNTVLNVLKNSAENGGKRVALNTEIPKESAKFFKQVMNATKKAWKGKTFSPFKELDITMPGAFSTVNLYLNRGINEGVEEVMEEGVLDFGKGIVSGLDALGLNVSDDTKKKIDFGLTLDDIISRYTTAFLGGALGGAVFEGMNKYDKWVFNDNANAIVGKSANARLINAIRENGAERVNAVLESLYRRKNGLGNESLSWKGKYVTDPKNSNVQTFKFEAGNPAENQNTLMYNIMKTRVQIFDQIMRDKNFNLDDNDLLERISGNISKKADKAGMSVEDYIKETGEDPIVEYMKKTGAGDIILFDVTNLQADIVELQTKLNAAKAKVEQQFVGDTSDIKQQREEAIKQDSYIKSLEEQIKEKEKQYNALINGDSAAYYIRLANFASQDVLVNQMLGKEDSNGNRTLPWTKEAFARLKYKVNYNNISEDEKADIDADYNDFITVTKKADLDALLKANDVYQATRDIVLRSLNGVNIGDIVQNTAFLPAMVQAKVGETEQDALANRAISNKPEEDWYSIITDKVNSGNTSEAILNLKQYIESLINNKIIALNFNDFKDYAYNKILNGLKSEISNINFAEIFKNINDNSDADSELENPETEFGKLKRAENIAQEKFNSIFNTYLETNPDSFHSDYEEGTPDYDAELEAFKNNTFPTESAIANAASDARIKYYKENKLDKYASGYQDFVNAYLEKFNDALSLIQVNPAQAIIKLTELNQYFRNNIASDEIYNQITEQTTNAINLLTDLQDAISRSNEIHQSPVIYLLNALATEYQGRPIKLLDLLDKEQKNIQQLKNVDDYVLDSFTASELNLTAQLIPIVETILKAATLGIDANTDKMLVDAGLESELPPEISPIFLVHTMNELAFVKNKIDYLEKLHELNQNAKTKEQVLVRKNFFRNIFKKLIEPEGISGDYLNKLNEILGEDIHDIWETAVQEAGENINVDFDSNEDEDQVNVMKVFIKFEQKLWEKTKNRDKTQLGVKLAQLFPDNWKLENGILSRDPDKELSDYDLSVYLMSIMGSDPNAFYNGLKNKFGEEKFPFFGQELAIRLAYTNIKTPAIINGFVSGLKAQLENAANNPEDFGLVELKADGSTAVIKTEDAKYLKSKQILENTSFVDGFAGVGKSTMVLKTALEIAGDSYEIFVAAKDGKRAVKLGEAIGLNKDSENIKTTDDLLKDILGKDYDSSEQEEKRDGHSAALKDPNRNFKFNDLFKTTKPRIIAIDEATQLNEAQLVMLSKAAKASNCVVILLGNSMQIGAADEHGNSLNIDNCVLVTGTKLTVSMRDGNAGKSRNNLIVGTKVSEIDELTKKYPTTGWEIISKRISGKVELDYGRDSEGRICGDEIVANIDMDLISKTVDKLHSDETLVIITENNALKSQINTKYKDDSRISIRTKADCAGDEFDFAIVDETISSDPDTKTIEWKNFYTYITRARKGSIIKTSDGLTRNLEISSKLSPTASATISSVVGSDAALKYKELRLKALENVSEVESTSASAAPTSAGSSLFNISLNNPSAMNFGNKKGKSAEELASDIAEEFENSSEEVSEKDNEEETDLEDSITLGTPKKGQCAKSYKQRKINLNGNHINYDDLAEKLSDLKKSKNTDINIANYVNDWLKLPKDLSCGLDFEKGINATNGETIENYKLIVNIIASAIFNTPYDSSNEREWKDNLINKFTDRLVVIGPNFIDDFRKSLIDAISNGTYRFIIQASDENVSNEKKDFYFYFPGSKKFIVPLGKIKTDQQGVFKHLLIDKNNISDVVLMSSNGQSRTHVDLKGRAATLDNKILILGNTDKLTTDDERVKNFIKNKGKAFIPICKEFGLTKKEILDLLQPEIRDGKVSYLYQRNISINLAGIQKEINQNDFFELLKSVQILTKNGASENKTDEVIKNAVTKVQQVFGYTDDEIQQDFAINQSGNAETFNQYMNERLSNISKKYGILNNRGRDLVISALISNGLADNQADDRKQTIRAALATHLNEFYNGNNNSKSARIPVIKLIWTEFGKTDLNCYVTVGTNENDPVTLVFGENYKSITLDDSNPNKIVTDIKRSELQNWLIGDNQLSISEIITKLFEKVNPKNLSKEFFDNLGFASNKDITVENVFKLIYDKNKNFRISIGTAVQQDDNNEYIVYPLYESKIYDFLTPEGAESPVFSEQEISDIIGSDPKYVNGIYTNIAAKKINGAGESYWMEGNADMDKRTWDIVDVLGATYGLGIDAMSDFDNSDNTLSSFAKTQIISNSEDVTPKISSQEISFEKSGVSTEIICDDKLKDALANSFKDKTSEEAKKYLNEVDKVSIVSLKADEKSKFVIIKHGDDIVEIEIKSDSEIFKALKVKDNLIIGKILDNFVIRGKEIYRNGEKVDVIGGFNTGNGKYIISIRVNNKFQQIQVNQSEYNEIITNNNLRGKLTLGTDGDYVLELFQDFAGNNQLILATDRDARWIDVNEFYVEKDKDGRLLLFYDNKIYTIQKEYISDVLNDVFNLAKLHTDSNTKVIERTNDSILTSPVKTIGRFLNSAIKLKEGQMPLDGNTEYEFKKLTKDNKITIGDDEYELDPENNVTKEIKEFFKNCDKEKLSILKDETKSLGKLLNDLEKTLKDNPENGIELVQNQLDEYFLEDPNDRKLYTISYTGSQYEIKENATDVAKIKMEFARNPKTHVENFDNLKISFDNGKYLVTLTDFSGEHEYNVEINGNEVNIKEHIENPTENLDFTIENIDKLISVYLSEYPNLMEYLKAVKNADIDRMFEIISELDPSSEESKIIDKRGLNNDYDKLYDLIEKSKDLKCV